MDVSGTVLAVTRRGPAGSVLGGRLERLTPDRRLPEVPIEALTWRLNASGPVPNVQLNFAGQKTRASHPIKGERPVWFADTGFAPCRVYDRYALAAGMRFAGPAVIEERESTTVAGPDTRVSVDQYLNLIIDIE